MPVRALHAAGLEYPSVTSDRIDHSPGLNDSLRERLLAENILAGHSRLDDRNGVPVVRRGNYHCVNIISGKQLAKISVGVTAFVCAAALIGIVVFDYSFPTRQLEFIDVAGSQNVCAWRIQKRPHQMFTLLARGDKAQRNPLTRRNITGFAQSRRRYNMWKTYNRRCCTGCSLDKLTPIKLFIPYHKKTLLLRVDNK